MPKTRDGVVLPGVERRYVCQDIRIEKRAVADGAEGEDSAEGGDGTECRTIKGYAAVYDTPSKPVWGWFIEIIKSGAFTKVLGTGPDVRALFNHDPSLILARTRSTTLELREDAKGLAFVFDAPKTSYGDDLLVSIARGDVSECSFQFICDAEDQEWEPIVGALQGEPGETRTILEVSELLDISLVTFPQYLEASAEISKRSRGEWEVAHKDMADVLPVEDAVAASYRENRLRLMGSSFISPLMHTH